MKKRILLYSLIISIGALVFFAVFSTFIYHSNLVDNTTRHLSVYMLSYKQNSAKFVNLDDAAAKELSAEVGGARVTIIATDGTVLADSEVSANEMDNHLDREEVKTALRVGTGSASRSSTSINQDYIYYCELFDVAGNSDHSQILIRIAQTGSSVWKVLVEMFPLLAVFIILTVLLCVALSNFSIRHVLKPIEDFGAEAVSKNEHIAAPYPELENIARIISDFKQAQEITMQNIKSEQLRERVVLDNMEHGIIILRAIDEVVLINKAASKLLSYDADDKVLYSLARDSELLMCVEERKGGLFYRKYGREEYAIRLSVVEEMDAMVVLITCVSEIRRAERTKNEFIANVTHEMNTPLTAISGFAELIASGKQSASAAKNNAKIIVEQSAKLGALIKSILNYSAIEGEQTELTTFDLGTLAAAAAEEFKPSIEASSLTLQQNIQPDIMITARVNRVREVVDNFISNAVRYNKAGGSITITVNKAASGRARLEVADTGIGIDMKNHARVFDRFYTVDTGRGSGGFGLGLAIVKKLANIYGWKIDLKSALNEGTKISIEF